MSLRDLGGEYGKDIVSKLPVWQDNPEVDAADQAADMSYGTDGEGASSDWSEGPAAVILVTDDFFGEPSSDDACNYQARAESWYRETIEFVGNEVFAPDELREIGRQLESLQGQVKQLLKVNDEQAQLIRELLASMQKSSNQLGKKDWLALAIGSATSLVIGGLVPQAAMWHLGAEAIRVLGQLFSR